MLTTRPLAAVPLNRPALIKGPIIPSSRKWTCLVLSDRKQLSSASHGTRFAASLHKPNPLFIRNNSEERVLKEEISLPRYKKTPENSFGKRMQSLLKPLECVCVSLQGHAETGSISFKWWSETTSAQRWQNNNTCCQTSAIPRSFRPFRVSDNTHQILNNRDCPLDFASISHWFSPAISKHSSIKSCKCWDTLTSSMINQTSLFEASKIEKL